MAAQNNETQVVILAGGYGSRLGEYTEKIPKPMVEVGGIPLIIHVMNLWKRAGFQNFIIAGGYKSECLEGLFQNNKDVQVVDTGLDTQTAGRIKRLEPYINGTFCVSYGDGLTSYPLQDLFLQHTDYGAEATMLVTHPTSRFGEVTLGISGKVIGFSEKPVLNHWINAGFFVMEPSIFSRIPNDESTLETHVFTELVDMGSLYSCKNEGWWHCMDTPKDIRELEAIWKSGEVPWA